MRAAPLFVLALLLALPLSAPVSGQGVWSLDASPRYVMTGDSFNVTASGLPREFVLLQCRYPNGTSFLDASGFTDGNGTLMWFVGVPQESVSGVYLIDLVAKVDGINQQVARTDVEVLRNDINWLHNRIVSVEETNADQEQELIKLRKENRMQQVTLNSQQLAVWVLGALFVLFAFVSLLLVLPYLRYASTRVRGRYRLFRPVTDALHPEPECELARFHPGVDDARRRLLQEMEPEGDGKTYLVKATSKLNPREVVEVVEEKVDGPKVLVPRAEGFEVKEAAPSRRGRFRRRKVMVSKARPAEQDPGPEQAPAPDPEPEAPADIPRGIERLSEEEELAARQRAAEEREFHRALRVVDEAIAGLPESRPAPVLLQRVVRVTPGLKPQPTKDELELAERQRIAEARSRGELRSRAPSPHPPIKGGSEDSSKSSEDASKPLEEASEPTARSEAVRPKGRPKTKPRTKSKGAGA